MLVIIALVYGMIPMMIIEKGLLAFLEAERQGVYVKHFWPSDVVLKIIAAHKTLPFV